MTNTPGVGPSHPDHKKPVEHIKKPDHTKKFKDSSGQPPQGFAQKAWGFDAAEAKKFISTLANTIITQIKHEDEQAKATADKLKQAEQGEDQ